ncbi:MAG: MoaD/ThiS family protein [Flavobacteriales bacterium]
MRVKVKYLGLIVDHTKCKEEQFELEKESFEELNSQLLSKYTFLQDISYKITINHEFGKEGMVLREHDEIAILPPFAGG